MPRWEADGRDRLELAALELFLEIGYDSTTVAAITKRAGLTERTFYRHFSDKREVLFSGGEVLTAHLVAQVRSAPPGTDPYRVVIEALSTAEQVFLPKSFVRRRVEAIAASSSLAERELIKLMDLTVALGEALQARGVGSRQARLLTDIGMSVFRIATEDWLCTQEPFADLLHRAVTEQQQAVTPRWRDG